VAQVGGLRVGIVPATLAALAGWYSRDSLGDAATPAMLDAVRGRRVDVFASTHTCLAPPCAILRCARGA
jgi:hypothetical protein